MGHKNLILNIKFSNTVKVNKIFFQSNALFWFATPKFTTHPTFILIKYAFSLRNASHYESKIGYEWHFILILRQLTTGQYIHKNDF